MMSKGKTIGLMGLLFCSVCLTACQKEEARKVGESERKSFTKRSDLETLGAGALVYLKGSKLAYTGVVISRDKDWQMGYFANYEGGELHGAEIWWHENGRMKKMLDYEHGEKVRHREWFESGVHKIDAMMKDGKAFGRHVKWFEDGSLRFSGNFVENLLWDGAVKDVHEDGKVMWDAVFKRGRYVSGVYPPSEKQKLIDGGMLKEDGGVDVK
ncbi:MAG: hypothetical protein L3J39_12650 [Verrucomicrobiales bacterium]|nr:hypothetical protein [Verrucomicrobiales bacterium]